MRFANHWVGTKLGVVALAAMAFWAGGCRASAGTVAPNGDIPPGIVVVGRGEATGTPDLARFDVGVQVRAATAQQATEQVSTQMKVLMDTLTGLGIAAKDIQTRNVSVYEEQIHEPWPPQPMPHMEGQPPSDTSGQKPKTTYVAHNIVNVTVRDLQKLGPVLGALGQSGANQIHGLQMDIEDPTQLQGEALTKAVEHARSQAEQLAKLAGVRLGRVVSMRTLSGGHGGPYPEMMAAKAMDSGGGEAMPVSAGELKVEQQVQVQFELDR